MSYDPDTATVSYHWTESVKDDGSMSTTLADTILVINDSDAYHIEAQMIKDETIVFRVFSYGASYADKTRINRKTNYEVPVVKLANCSTEDINNKKMVILIPFFLLKLRGMLKNKKSRTPENIETLKSLIKTDIMGSIDKNVELGNITPEDGAQLYRLTQVLYTRLYSAYEETEEVTDMVEQSIITFVDVFQEEKAKLQKEIAEKDAILADNCQKLAEKDSEIASLKAELAALKAKNNKENN